MDCPSCQHTNDTQARFCNQCGTTLAASCSQCSANNAPDAKFCNQCGFTLGQPTTTPTATQPERSVGQYTPKHLADRILSNRSALEGERKQVTVMFADLQGSMELAEQVDAERWHEILDEFFAILGEEIHRVEGTINQYTGDGIMALFGAPIAHEDHAVRACRAALALRERLNAFGRQLRLEDGLNVSVRLGLNSGEVVVGTIGDDLRMDYTAQGHTVGLAARMESLAAPGTVLMTRHTARLVEGYFRLNDLGTSKVKGVAEPISLYELESEGRFRTRLDLSRERGLSPFIGREKELEQLASVLQYKSTSPKGLVASVQGDAGIGKSRICHEVAEEARNQGIDVFTCACVPYADAEPFKPIRELIRAYFGVQDNDEDNTARQKIAGSLTLLNLGDSSTLQLMFEFLEVADPNQKALSVPPELRLKLLFELYDRFNTAAPNRRSLIIVDDLHWADPGSLAFLERMLTEVCDHPVSIIYNFRPHQPPRWLSDAQIKLDLKPLDQAAMLELAERLMGDDQALEALCIRLADRAAGNPYFVEEAVQAFIEAGTLVGDAGSMRLTKPVEDVKIPDTIHALIGARIDRLTEDQKQALLSASVIGKEFPRALMLALLQKNNNDLSDKTLTEQLNQLKTLGFIEATVVDEDCDQTTPCHWQFRHPLIQEVAYHSQLKNRRSQTHSQLAELLEAETNYNAANNEVAVQLAYHYERAKNWDKAAHWLPVAATWMAGRDMGDALRRYYHAIETLDNAPDSAAVMHGRITARAGILRVGSFYQVPIDTVDKAWHEAKALVSASGDQAGLAELQVSYAMAQMRDADADDGVSNATEALMMSRTAEGGEEIEGRFRTSILLAYFGAGRVKEGLDLLTEQGREAWINDSVSLDNYYSRGFRALMISYTGELDQAISDLGDAIKIATAQGNPVSWLHANVVEWCNLSGNSEQALREGKQAIQHALETQSDFFTANAYRAVATANCLAGNWQEAIAACEAALPLTESGTAAYQFRAAQTAVYARALLGDGQYEKAYEVGNDAIEQSQQRHARIAECQARLTMLSILRKLGKDSPAQVEHQLNAITTLISQTGAVMFEPFMLEEKARLLWRKNEHAEANKTLSLAHKMYLEFGAKGHAERLKSHHPELQLRIV